MTDVTIYANGATITGVLKTLQAGRPMMGPVRCDTAVVRVTMTVTGPDTESRVGELLAACDAPPPAMTSRTALILAANMLEAECRRLEVDTAAAKAGCEECTENARRHEEYRQALGHIREMLADSGAD